MVVAVSQDGRYVAAAREDGIARVWDYKTGARVARLGEQDPTGETAAAPLSSCSFDRNGTSLLVTSFNEAEIKIWNVDSRRLIRRFKGYEGSNAAALSGSGTLAVTADISSAPKLWDVTSGGVPTSLTPVVGSWAVAFSRDAQRIAASSSDGTIYVFDCAACGPHPEIQKLGERRIAHRLTPDELRAILGE